MLEIIMPQIRRHWHKRDYLLIDGGWLARVPRVSATDPTVTNAYTAYFLEDGLTKTQARVKAEGCIQERFNYGFLSGLKSSIFGYAVKYATMYPELRQVEEQFKTGNRIIRLRGFDPSQMQTAYVPEQRPGSDGLPYVREMLRAMGQTARRAT